MEAFCLYKQTAELKKPHTSCSIPQHVTLIVHVAIIADYMDGEGWEIG
jgi:hypothetical protein